MTERVRFVLAHQDGLYSMTELCQRFGVSRKIGYKWLRRFEAEGLDGLAASAARRSILAAHRSLAS